jgi:hypothetical protein
VKHGGGTRRRLGGDVRSFLAGVIALGATAVVPAQDYSIRVGQQADRLKIAAAALADRALRDLLRNTSNSRAEIQAALLAQQIDASAAACVELIRNRRPGREIRDVASELTDLARRAPAASSQGSMWRGVQNAIADLNRELGGPGRGDPPPRPIIGQVSWRGFVDDRVHLAIRGSSIETRTVSGVAQREGASTFTSPLPASPVEVDVVKVSGRGTVKVVQQPSQLNDFTAVIEIYDNQGGAQEYRLDIVWR